MALTAKQEREMEIKYHETTIEDIISYFVKGFTDIEIINYEQFVDIGSGKVILKMLIK